MFKLILFLLFINNVLGDLSKEVELCKDKIPDEFFRIKEDDCRNVVRCSGQGLLSLRCPSGLAFDVEKQTCAWRAQVKNCDKLQKERKAKPRLNTEEPLCEANKIACGTGECVDAQLYCNGVHDCADGSDENICTVDEDPNRAPPCDESQCVLPDCFCSIDGTQIPGKLDPENVPQMVMLSFDDAVNMNNDFVFNRILNQGRKNPNGCDIKATFFVSHKYTNYSGVQELHRKGHEIAVHSISHNPDEDYWNNADRETWLKEMAGSRLIIERFANITDNSILGVRAPNLRVGGNNQFFMMEEQGFMYDSSITAPLSNPPLWPYTLFFKMPHRCHGNGQKCPSRSFPVWEIVMNELDRRDDPQFDEDLSGCAMIDSCGNILSTDQLYNFLNHNFNRHYRTNRAPFPLFFHAAYFKANPEFLDVFEQWMDEVLQKGDVYFVTMTQVLHWVQSPHDSSRVKEFAPWKEKCAVKGFPLCSLPRTCRLDTREVPGETLHMQTCMKCPESYPWVENPTGELIEDE